MFYRNFISFITLIYKYIKKCRPQWQWVCIFYYKNLFHPLLSTLHPSERSDQIPLPEAGD